MNIELMPGLTNVVRFPVELRVLPSIELIYDIEPDVREVLLVGESFFLELPESDLRQQVDAETAIYITDHILLLTRDEQTPALNEPLRPVLTRGGAGVPPFGSGQQAVGRGAAETAGWGRCTVCPELHAKGFWPVCRLRLSRNNYHLPAYNTNLS